MYGSGVVWLLFNGEYFTPTVKVLSRTMHARAHTHAPPPPSTATVYFVCIFLMRSIAISSRVYSVYESVPGLHQVACRGARGFRIFSCKDANTQ